MKPFHDREPSRSPPTDEHDKLWGGGALILAAATLALLFASPDKSQAIAAWVQAVGSIAAIYIALRIGQQQSKAAIDAVTNAQSLAESAKRKSVLTIATSAHELASNVRKAFGSDDINWALASIYDPKVIDLTVDALHSAPLQDIGSPEGVSALLSLRLQFVLLGKAVDTFVAGPWLHPEMKKNLETWRDDSTFDKRLLAECLDTSRNALRHNVFMHLDVIKKDFERLQESVTAYDGSI